VNQSRTVLVLDAHGPTDVRFWSETFVGLLAVDDLVRDPSNRFGWTITDGSAAS
jgi:hypothetical protein